MRAALSVLFFCVISKKFVSPASCGYDSCTETDGYRINVHLIPHSHDDVGWLKSVEEYFYGVHAGVGVSDILSSVYQALKENEVRTYTQVETAFFWKWFEQQSDQVKQGFNKLISNGQIEIANGGFVMNDEASVHYQSTIDQFTRGLRILNDTLGPCGTPRVGWQIDPFGHSREQALIYKQLGFDGAFFARLDYRDRLLRMKEKRLDFLWRSTPNIADSEIFYGILMNHYGSPTGFCYDIMCSDEPINDDEDSFENNAEQKINEFSKVIEEFSNYSTTNHILIPMGGDFNFEQAEEQYTNIDRLIKLFKYHNHYHVFYSTPSCYLKGVNSAKPTLSVKVDDFFPYASDEHAYWTGYFTSRTTSKRFERIAHKILQASKQLRSIFKITLKDLIKEDTDAELTSLKDSIAIMQHHDAVAGTEKQKVADDYVRLINDGIRKSEESIGTIIGSLLTKDKSKFDKLVFSSCLLSNISICENSSKDRFVVAVYNPLSKPVIHFVHLPVPDGEFSVLGPDENEVLEKDLVEPISNFSYVSVNELKPAPKTLVFTAKEVPPMGTNLYYVTKQSDKIVEKLNIAKSSDLVFGTDTLNFVLDSESNLLKSVTMNGVTLSITQNFYYYPSENGTHNFVPSGAYLFRPTSGTKKATAVSKSKPTLEYSVKGKVVEEAHLKINDWIKQIIRVYKGGEDSYIEFDWLVGPIEVDSENGEGKEVISRFSVNGFQNEGIFYTDSNGRETLKRFRNSRADYTYDPEIEPITSNYYPVTCRLAMRDEQKQLEVAVFNDRSQGGSSINDGQLELMVQRRLLVDDFKGLAEALNEQEFGQPLVVRGKHYLMFGFMNDTNINQKGKSFSAAQREFQSKIHLSPYTLVADARADDLKYETLKDNLNFQMQFLNTSLPDNVNILTFERWRDEVDTYLIRLEHLLEKDEDSKLSQNVTVDIGDIFENHKIEEIKETTLGANVWMDDYNNRETKFVWISDTNQTIKSDMYRTLQISDDELNTKVTLTPMEIRTFVIKIS